MSQPDFAALFAAEDRHFWFRARNHVIATLVSQIMADRSQSRRLLEVGCGTGNVLRVLEQACPHCLVIGMDLFAQGLQFAAQRTRCHLVQGDMRTTPFNIQFDLIGLFDVLEHLPDDSQVLRDLHGMLAREGTLLLTVPAHASLWSYFDEASHHYRRYELPELEGKLIAAGYRVEYLSQYMAGIFPLMWLKRRLAALIGRRWAGNAGDARDLASGELRIIPMINDLLAWGLAQEARLIRRRLRLPIGTSLLAVARKESASP